MVSPTGPPAAHTSSEQEWEGSGVCTVSRFACRHARTHARTHLHSLYPLQFPVQDGRHVGQLDAAVDGMAQQFGQQLEVLAGGGGQAGRDVLLRRHQQLHQAEELLWVLAALRGQHKDLLPRSHPQVSEGREGAGW